MNKVLYLITVFLFVGLITGCTGEGQKAKSADTSEAAPPAKGQSAVMDDESQKNILQIAIGSADHSTLVAAVQAAEIEDVLANNGPLTVFAPTNDAFANLPEGTVENLLKPENKKTLANILWYHAAPGTYKGDLLKDGMSLYQASGNNVKIEKKGEDVFVNGAKILGTVDAANGVVHVVDAVLLPPE